MAVGTGKGERGGSLRGGMQMQLSRESLPLSGRFNGWESCYLHPERRATWRSNLGRGAHWKEGKYQVSRESVSSTWLVGWESWYLPLPACFAKVRLLFVALFINLGAETIFQLTNQTLVSLCFRVLPCQFSCFVPF